ncbi:MAG: hypothetical protein GXO79_06305 [Chlorobi bacterium]|nr:hypothetical protein [Chlorobiota bacterium]
MKTIEDLIKLRNEVFAWAKIELQNIKVINTETKIEILINLHGLKHTLKGKSFKNYDMIEKNEAMIMSVKHLKFFLETSKYIGFEEDKKMRDNILGFHIFTNIFNYKNVEYDVKIMVKETRDKTYFYDQALIEKK